MIMKKSLWILGTIAAVTGGILIVKHLAGIDQRHVHYNARGDEKRVGAIPLEYPESEFEGADFLS
jgi:hypothetical protein